MDPTYDCEMFLSDDRRKGTESSLKDEYIPDMVLKKLLAHTERRRDFPVKLEHGFSTFPVKLEHGFSTFPMNHYQKNNRKKQVLAQSIV